MKCEDCLPRIEEYVDGELDGRLMGRVASHLSTCAGCASELAELNREQEIYAHYQREIEVTPAQWNIVQARIEQEKDALLPESRPQLRERLHELFGSRNQFRPAFVAALVLIVIGITTGVIYLTSRSGQTEFVQSPKQTETQSPAKVKQDPPSESNHSDETIAGTGNQEQSNSNRQKPVLATSTAATGSQKKTVVIVANPPRPEKPGVKPSIPDKPAQFETATSARNNVITNVRQASPEATGDFNFEIARHAERAEMLLRSFRNVRLPAANRALDVSYEKAQSRKLLYQNIALRRDAATRGDQPAMEVLNTLEPILLDIANLPNRAKARDVRSIEQDMKKKEIVATLQVRTLVASN